MKMFARLLLQRHVPPRVVFAVLCAFVGGLLQPSQTYASGVFWLPTKPASDASFNHLNPVLAAYHNRAYTLSVRDNGTSSVTSVFLSTNESGHWSTQLVSNMGPRNTYFNQFTSLAVDGSTGRLYAIWAYQKNADDDAIGVWMKDPGGQWTGPVDIMTGGSLGGQPSIVAGNGRAYAAFVSSRVSGACDDSTSRSGDINVAAYDGSNWSAPENLTSCVSDTSILEFSNPKLALDENGQAHLVSVANGDLWYAENASGSWSAPVQITQAANIPDSVGTALRVFYGVAASNAVTYLTYVRLSGVSTYDVLLMSKSAGGTWSAASQVSPPDSQGCPKFGVSLVANAGRVGLSYVRGHTGYCASSSGISGNVPFVFTGSPGQMKPVASLIGTNPDCFSTSLTNEGSLFRFVASCDHSTSLGNGQLYYKAEFLDTVGPIAHLSVTAHSRANLVLLRWSARDPQPGSGIASYQLRVRDGGNTWHVILASTRLTHLSYRQGVSGHRYTFEVRARDRTANWGAWVSARATIR